MNQSQSSLANPITTTIQTSACSSQADRIPILVRPSDAAPRSFVGLTDAASIDTLAPGQPLDLQAVIYVLERAARLWPGHVHVVDTHILDVLPAVGEDNEMFNENRCQIASIPVGGVVLFPICSEGHHFLLVFKKCLVQGALFWQTFVYDSILLNRLDEAGWIARNYWDYITSRIAYLHRSLFSFCIPMQRLYINLMMCPQQPNGYDCGVSVCLNAMDIITYRGMATCLTYEAAYCTAPEFNIIRDINRNTRHGDESSINQLSRPGLYWSAGRQFVFQLCGRAIDRPHANREALLTARESVSASLEALVRSEQDAFVVNVPPVFNPADGPLLSAMDEETRAWNLQCWFQSKETLGSLMKRLQGMASTIGTVTSRAADVHVFTAALTIGIHPMHEAHRQRTREIAQDNAWQDPEIVQELFADFTTARMALEGLRLPEGWEAAVPKYGLHFQAYL